MNMKSDHTFHIPVMGLGFTIDTPVKVAHFGISSVVSIVEDHLIEQMREVLCKKENLHYAPITTNDSDYRAKRITEYLNLLNVIVIKNTELLRKEAFDENKNITKYFELLPEDSILKALYHQYLTSRGTEKTYIEMELRKSIQPGSIDVNIMTKVDKTNYDKEGTALAPEYSDALSALRGFANSDLNSSVIFSAGLNPRLYSYCENFEEFYPDAKGSLKKKIVLKVSDYRSALIQGKFLAKKGLWISEFRVESGLNCGGHAFATEGILLGPILEEFKTKRDELLTELYTLCESALAAKGKQFQSKPETLITAQGGIGTSFENQFLLDHYNLDSTGWGSPFLLVPEATNVDTDTINKLATAKQEDYYLSHSSPLGIPFNNFRPSSSEEQRQQRITKNRPGSPCYKKFLAFDTEFTEKPICTASREYQNLKIKQAREKFPEAKEYEAEVLKITEKDCLCEGLGSSALQKNNAKLSHGLKAVAICPGPNLAFFSGTFSLREMIDHIYGRKNVLNSIKRPNVFINELKLYIDYLSKEIGKHSGNMNKKQSSYFHSFQKNLISGIEYYISILPSMKLIAEMSEELLEQLCQERKNIETLQLIPA